MLLVSYALPDLRLRAAIELEKRRRLGSVKQQYLTFADFLTRHAPHIHHYPHIKQLVAVLQKVADGEVKRLMVFMPPRHGKSEIVSRWFPAYLLYRFPEKWVAIASYAANLAYTLSRNARDNYQRAGGILKEGAAGVEHWETGRGGGLWAAGVGGAATGKGGHTMIVDDPLKNAEEAASETIREKHKDWWRSTWYTRLEPDAAMVVVQTRWNEDDLSGWLLSEEQGDEPERWHIVSMAAIKGDGEIEIPATCTLEPDARRNGEALCEERYPLKRLLAIKARIGSYYWGALYDQRPSPREGNMFKRAWFEIVEAVPSDAVRVRFWDKAASEGKGDYTTGVKIACANGKYYIEDVVRGQWSSGERDRVIRQTAVMDGYDVTQYAEEEPGSSGKDASLAFVNLLVGFSAKGIRSTGNKVIRADALASQAEVGNVKLVKGEWNRAFLEEITSFPTGAHDDQVDGASGAFNQVVESTQPLLLWG